MIEIKKVKNSNGLWNLSNNYKKFILSKVEGLDPPNANVITKKAGQNGTIFAGSSINERNIVLYFNLFQNIYGYKDMIYEFFCVGSEVQLSIDVDGMIYNTTGYVESINTNLYSEETLVQISIICCDPFLYGESITLNVPAQEDVLEYEYWGNYSAYLNIEVKYTANETNFEVNVNDKSLKILYNFEKGDTLYINCVNKAVKVRKKMGNFINLYNKKQGDWLYFSNGCNEITEASHDCTFKFKETYLGV